MRISTGILTVRLGFYCYFIKTMFSIRSVDLFNNEEETREEPLACKAVL